MKSRHPYSAVQQAILRGDLIRQPCEVCGALETQAHHDDYSKPLEVRWLCILHHKQWHKENAARKNPNQSYKDAKTIYLSREVSRQLAASAKVANVSQSVYVTKVLRARFKKDGIK